MRVFVTGAAGFIGRAVIPELINNGHTVLGLVRSDASAETITKLGAEVHRGDLEDIESLKSGAAASDGVIHLAFVHDFANMAKSSAIDRAAITAMADHLEGKPLVITNGTMSCPKGVLATEDTEGETVGPAADRVKAEALVKELTKTKGIRGSVVRLTPTVHGLEDKGFIKIVAGLSQKAGAAIYINDGSSRWSAVHRLDAAVLYRLALEKGQPGAIYHAVAEEGVPTKDIVTLIGKKTGLPVEGKTMEEATPLLGFFAHALAADNPASSEKTRKELGWTPTQITLLKDIEENYFK
ncbi:putative NAD dependent epimerase/dehydratase [Talaromyces proteolyticus]|uniref:NAD dependent epimerase/dehydratase n=1 Tax=Talaromyces proteolyticus TaxID=1131652 RepID=A0AAD4L4R1_9EURO|nr:putative NAD dependent epimerase/dehydratase [Talaromyces proteolyticus]KAH8703542.1 putative NAD dependent epimerase/dehydratase [Talaromyces proteolyticus]